MASWNTGRAYWVSNFPALDGGEAKGRPAVYLDLDDMRGPHPQGHLVFVATTCDEWGEIDLDGKDHDALRLECELPKPCWAMPRWTREVPPDDVGPQVGGLTGPQIVQLIDAVLERAPWLDDISK